MWISVKDRLPELQVSVLCCQASKEISQVYLQSTDDNVWVTPYGIIINIFNNDPITHWMSLPDSPN